MLQMIRLNIPMSQTHAGAAVRPVMQLAFLAAAKNRLFKFRQAFAQPHLDLSYIQGNMMAWILPARQFCCQ